MVVCGGVFGVEEGRGVCVPRHPFSPRNCRVPLFSLRQVCTTLSLSLSMHPFGSTVPHTHQASAPEHTTMTALAALHPSCREGGGGRQRRRVRLCLTVSCHHAAKLHVDNMHTREQASGMQTTLASVMRPTYAALSVLFAFVCVCVYRALL